MKALKYLVNDAANYYNYLNWSKAISDQMAAFGYVQTNDSGQTTQPVISCRILSAVGNGSSVVYTYDTLAGGTFAVNQQVQISDCSTSSYNTVMNAIRIVQGTDVTFVLTAAIRQTAVSFTPSTATASGANLTVNCASTIGAGGVNTYQNWCFTLSGMNNSANNGTFMCLSSTNTSVVLDVLSAVTETPTGSPACAASSSVTSYVGTISGGTSNVFQGIITTVAGFTNSGNNSSTITASRVWLASGVGAFAIVNTSGVTETHAGTAVSVSNRATVLGTFTGGASDAFVGMNFQIKGSSTVRNNVYFTCTSSSATTLMFTARGITTATTALTVGSWASITAVTTTTSTSGTFTIANTTSGTEYESVVYGAWASAVVGPTCTVTKVQSTGTTATYTYSGLQGTLRVGQLITVVGTSTNSGGFNQTQKITSFTSTTFTVVGNNNGTIGLTTDSGVATVRTLGQVPGIQSTTAVYGAYEIWGSNDGLTTYYVRYMYLASSSSSMQIAVQLGTGTDGAGNLTGNISNRDFLAYENAAIQARTPTESFFYGSGSGASFSAMMLHSTTASVPNYFAIERGKNSVGADANAHVTLLYGKGNTTTAAEHTLFLSGSQATFSITSVANNSGVYTGTFANGGSNAYANYVFTITGLTNDCNNGTFLCTASSTTTITLATDFSTISESASATGTVTCGPRDIDVTCINRINNLPSTWAAGNNLVISPVFPSVGYFANPLANTVVSCQGDVVDGMQAKIKIGGSVHNYIFCNTQALSYIGGTGGVCGLGMRYE